MNNYVCYHLHSSMSNGVTNIDSITKYPEYIQRAKELGMTALAFSEHGSVFNWYEKKQEIEKAGLKYIHAEEFYITEKIDHDLDGNPIKIRDNWHCILIAKNYDGVREINRLASKSFNRSDGHYYYAPRIEFEDLLNTSDNIIVTTACLAGILHKANLEIKTRFIKFLVENKHRCFLEIQHHNVDDQIAYNLELLKIHNAYDIPLIAGTDTHSLNADHARGRIMLQKAKDVSFPEEDKFDLTFKSYTELVQAYKEQNCLPESIFAEAIDNTNKMADMVEVFEMDCHTKYPHIYGDPEQTFKDKINKAFHEHPYAKIHNDPKEIIKRVKEEFAVYEKVQAIDFMLLECYIREWEKKNDIWSGPGRGSVSGSMIAYLLNITKMDSMRFNLNFFRFMNPARVTNADIDTDYYEADREKIKYFLLHDKMDLPNIKTSEIITFNTIATKGAIKDIARAMKIPLAEAQTLSNAVDMDGNIPDQIRKAYPTLCEYVDLVSGTIVSIGSHPSGVLVSDRDIEADVGMCSLGTSDYPVSMLDMHSLDALMYVKLDILGLDNVGVINETCRLAGIDILTPDNTDLDDVAVWNSIRDDTTLIFQWESESAQAYLAKFMSDENIKIAKKYNPNFSYIKWMSFGNGLIRPGCASFRDNIANGEVKITGFKELDEFLSITFGNVTMQEDIMRFCKLFCGYSDAESDTVRRAIAKKKGTENLLGELHDRFLSYSHETYGVNIEKLEEIFPPIKQGILDASAYAFSWNHSDAYSCIGYISGYLRYYYPVEFLTASLNIFSDKGDKTVAITHYADKVGVKILPPKFRHSRATYTMEKDTRSIYKGLKSIKYLNEQVAESLYQMRDQKFDTFVDLLKVFSGDTRQLDVLIRIGYFSEFGKTRKLLNIVELFDKFNGKKQLKKDKIDLPEAFLRQYCLSETEKMFKFDEESMSKMLGTLCSQVENVEIPLQTRIKNELEYLGYVQTSVPEAKNTAVIMDLDCKYSPKLQLVDISTKEMFTAKISKKSFQYTPVLVGDIINYRIEEKPRMFKDENGVWQEDMSRMEKWLAFYGITTQYS